MTQTDVCPGGSGYDIVWTNPVSFSAVLKLLASLGRSSNTERSVSLTVNIADHLLAEHRGIFRT
jgi:hypothetical protein